MGRVWDETGIGKLPNSWTTGCVRERWELGFSDRVE